jgi:hypothetical protein
MKTLLLGLVLAASASLASAQELGEECDPLNSDTWCLDPYESPGATFGDGVIGVYRPGVDSPWIGIFNPNNPRTLPPNPVFPNDPLRPVILTRPGT